MKKTTAMVVIGVIVAAFTMAMGGEVYKVGGSAGWTNIGHVDYKTWASTKIFRVGDTIVFDYHKDFQNVARVTYTDFLACDGAAPYSTFTSGNDTIPIKYPGHYYFICTLPGHCESGQKVDIRVPVAGRHTILPSSAAPIQPLPFPYPPPSAPSRSPVKSPPSQSSSPAPTKSPLPVPTQSPPPPPIQSPSPAPSLPKESSTSTPVIPSPEIAPAAHKNTASQLVSKVKIWSTLIAAFICLIEFSS